jgi:hypothetical protein
MGQLILPCCSLFSICDLALCSSWNISLNSSPATYIQPSSVSFLELFQVHSTTDQKVACCHVPDTVPHSQPLHRSYPTPECRTFVSTDRYHWKATVYLRVHSQQSTLLVFLSTHHSSARLLLMESFLAISIPLSLLRLLLHSSLPNTA